jgi:hypothetical protein
MNMRIPDLSAPARFTCLLSLLTVSACNQPVPQANPSAARAQPGAVVAGFYKEVVARHPIADMGDRKVFGRYLSKGLLHRFDDNAACFGDWTRQNPGTTDKPPFAQLEYGVYSGSNERSNPQTFHIEKTEAGKGGSSRVYVKLTYAEPTFKLLWQVAAIVVDENGQPVVDDVIYLKDDDNPEEWRLSALLADGCKGPRWVG